MEDFACCPSVASFQRQCRPPQTAANQVTVVESFSGVSLSLVHSLPVGRAPEPAERRPFQPGALVGDGRHLGLDGGLAGHNQTRSLFLSLNSSI